MEGHKPFSTNIFISLLFNAECGYTLKQVLTKVQHQYIMKQIQPVKSMARIMSVAIIY